MSENKIEDGQLTPARTVHMINGTFVLLPFDVVRHIKELEDTLEILGKDNAGWFRQHQDNSQKIKDLEAELVLRTEWTNHHKKVSEIDAQKKHDAEAKMKGIEFENVILENERRSLEAKLAEAESSLKIMIGADRDNVLLVDKLDIAIEALEFYGGENWQDPADYPEAHKNRFSEIDKSDWTLDEGDIIGGKRAREAIQKISEGV